MSGPWHVEVDQRRCEATGMCEGAAPEFFVLDAEGKARPRDSSVEASDTVLLAASCCPTEAITVTERDSGRQLAPLLGRSRGPVTATAGAGQPGRRGRGGAGRRGLPCRGAGGAKGPGAGAFQPGCRGAGGGSLPAGPHGAEPAQT